MEISEVGDDWLFIFAALTWPTQTGVSHFLIHSDSTEFQDRCLRCKNKFELEFLLDGRAGYEVNLGKTWAVRGESSQSVGEKWCHWGIGEGGSEDEGKYLKTGQCSRWCTLSWLLHDKILPPYWLTCHRTGGAWHRVQDITRVSWGHYYMTAVTLNCEGCNETG